jgi:hypothetical protein
MHDLSFVQSDQHEYPSHRTIIPLYDQFVISARFTSIADGNVIQKSSSPVGLIELNFAHQAL